MFINIDNDGKVLSAGYGIGWSGYPVTGMVPEDFMDMFALGKYVGRIVNNSAEIHAVAGWVPPSRSLVNI